MFVKTIHKSRIVSVLLLTVSVAGGAALLLWPQAAAAGVSRGLAICSSVIIPSLFPFLVLSGFLVRSGLSVKLGRHMDRVTRTLFGLPGCCGAGILIGFIGGYPAGGMAAGELVKQGSITRQEGKKMLRFCVNGGPAFAVSAVGAGLMGDVRYGVMLYIAHIAASLLIGLADHLWEGGSPGRQRKVRHLHRSLIPTNELPADRTGKNRKKGGIPVTAAFVESVNAACSSLLYMCGFVVLFAALLSLLDATGAAGQLHRLLSAPFRLAGGDTRGLDCLLPCLLEVSCGCVEAAHSGAAAPLLLGMAMGWGGLSVHCQLAAALHGEGLLDRSFFAARALHGLLGGAISVLLFRFVPIAVGAFAPSAKTMVVPFYTSATASLALLAMCALLLLTTAGKKR
ncbi:MAG: hypothetical protein HFJ80_03025 [Clostridiales bacterium]|nr:hypothetical protein [Clostridiales bacterium]